MRVRYDAVVLFSISTQNSRIANKKKSLVLQVNLPVDSLADAGNLPVGSGAG
jgi:hypothetical protein